jgi:glycosyltransferase involved in cell wall biosynthesis
VNKENGILIANENITELADAMQEVMKNYPLYNKKNIADNAVEKFNYTTVGAQYLETYNNI